MSYRVRPLEHADVPNLMAIGKAMHAESLFRDMDFDAERAANVLHMAADTDDFFSELIVDSGDVPVGGLLARLMDTFFGNELMAHDVMFFVAPPHRPYCAHAFQRLLRHYAEWGRRRGVRRVFLATASGIVPQRTARVLNRAGFLQVGTVHEAQEAIMGGGGGGGGGGSNTYQANLMQDELRRKEAEEAALRDEILAGQKAQQEQAAQFTTALLGLAGTKDSESKTLSAVEENKKAIQRANPIPFMTTGYTGVAGADSRLLGGSRYTLG